MKETRIKIPEQWNKKWYYAVDEEYALSCSKTISSKTFSIFHRKLVGIFGACEEECSAYLWNKIHPDKSRKFLISIQG